jgi:regulator of protease activity HflC (stomatin/prohibitin superfamily)
VVDPNKSVIEVENFVQATSQISQTTLRSVLGKKDLDDLLANREAINAELQTIIDEQTEPWGIKVSVIEINDVEIPQQMQRAMSRHAESERERRAKIIAAERASTRRPRGFVRPPTNWIARRPSSSDFSKPWPRSPPSRTRR